MFDVPSVVVGLSARPLPSPGRVEGYRCYSTDVTQILPTSSTHGIVTWFEFTSLSSSHVMEKTPKRFINIKVFSSRRIASNRMKNVNIKWHHFRLETELPVGKPGVVLTCVPFDLRSSVTQFCDPSISQKNRSYTAVKERSISHLPYFLESEPHFLGFLTHPLPTWSLLAISDERAHPVTFEGWWPWPYVDCVWPWSNYS